jgi:diguanylate cyclase (GGDEF)-like protein
MPSGTQWNELTAQQLVRYDALFKLLDDIQALEDIEQIARRVATQWKYLANVTSFRMVVAQAAGFLVIDGFRGDAQVREVPSLSPWDGHHWDLQRPRLVRLCEPPLVPEAPAHLCTRSITEIEVLPFVRLGRCIGLLSAAARHEAFSELDNKFIRLFGRHFVDRINDILLRRAAIQALVDKATRDALTGLFNRGAITERLGSQFALARRTGQPLGVVVADIDNFKVINDRHGHPVGDEVLIELARRLQAQTRDGDSLGRYGGEEFLVVLYPCNADEAATAAERLRAAVAQTAFRTAGDPQCELRITISLGCTSTADLDDCDLQSLLKRADDALYRSKAEGRNRATASPRARCSAGEPAGASGTLC